MARNLAKSVINAVSTTEVAENREAKIIDQVTLSHQVNKNERHSVYVADVEVDDDHSTVNIVSKDAVSGDLIPQLYICRGNKGREAIEKDRQAVGRLCGIVGLDTPTTEQILNPMKFVELWKKVTAEIVKIKGNEYQLFEICGPEYDKETGKTVRSRYKSMFFPDVTMYVTEGEAAEYRKQYNAGVKSGMPTLIDVADRNEGKARAVVMNQGKKPDNVMRCGETGLPVFLSIRTQFTAK